MKKKILIVVDMQNDFVDGALGSAEAIRIVPNVKEKITTYYKNGDRIIFTRDTHDEDYLTSNEGKHLPVKHCIAKTDGWQLYSEIIPDVFPVEKFFGNIINKPTFGYLDWHRYIEFPNKAEDLEIELIGLCTDICVVSNALILKAMFPEATVRVDSKACAGVTPATHEAALTTMKMCQIEVSE